MTEKEFETPNYPKWIKAKKKEFNLSEKIKTFEDKWHSYKLFEVKDIKEFIKRQVTNLNDQIKFLKQQERNIRSREPKSPPAILDKYAPTHSSL